MWPLCSSTRATPLKIITTARRSVHTLTGSKEVFRTKTLPFILRLILRERGRECQKYVATGALTAMARWRFFTQRRKDGRKIRLCVFAPLREKSPLP
jgi:hypothetical protein